MKSRRHEFVSPTIFRVDILNVNFRVGRLMLSVGNQLGGGCGPGRGTYHRHMLMPAPSLKRAWHCGVLEIGMREPRRQR